MDNGQYLHCSVNSVLRRVAADNSCPVRCESLRILIVLGIAPFLTVGADIIRPTVECYEFAENQCGIVTFYRRAVNNRPYIGYGTSNRQTGIL